MGATHSHVCRAHSLFQWVLHSTQQDTAQTSNRLLRARIRAVLFRESAWSSEDCASNMQHLEISLKQEAKRCEIFIGSGVLGDLGKLIREGLDSQPRRIGVISNKRVFSLYGAEILTAFK